MPDAAAKAPSSDQPDQPGPGKDQDGDEETPEPEPLELTITPFLEPGIYPLAMTLEGPDGPATSSFEVGFVDFVWGRDNFRFGNNSSYESRIGDYSEVLREWVEERFDSITDLEHAVLTYYMYSLFGSNAGRCYAFSGSQLRYHRNPDLLPSYYDSIYDIREYSRTYQREMHYLQLDVVYDHFVAGGFDYGREQSRLELLRELKRIRAGITDGSPVVTGYIAPDLHHSMLVYGYILDRARERVDLIVANNWKDEEDLNLFSRDANIVRVHLAADHEAERIEWLTRSGSRKRTPDRMFVVEIQEEYDHDRRPMERLVARRIEELRDAGRRAIIAEDAGTAWITDADGNVTGYKRNRTHDEIAAVTYDRVQESVLFEYPVDGDYTLEFKDREAVRLFHVDPGTEAEEPTAWLHETEPPSDEGDEGGEEAPEKPVIRRVRLAPEGPRMLDEAETVEESGE
jgi:hypothetical protein